MNVEGDGNQLCFSMAMRVRVVGSQAPAQHWARQSYVNSASELVGCKIFLAAFGGSSLPQDDRIDVGLSRFAEGCAIL